MQSVQLHDLSSHDELLAGAADASQILSQTIVPSDILRTFVAIYECGSYTKVARALQLTQPAISAQMKKLESLVGTALIARTASGITLTTRGQEVLAAARRMLSISQQILSSRSQSVPTIRIGVPNIFAPLALTALSANARGKTNVRVQLFCDHSRKLHQSVRSGYLEMAFVLGEDVDPSETLSRWTEDFVWMRAPELTVNADQPVPLICSPNRILSDRLAIEAFRRSNRKFEVVFSSFDRTAREFAVRSGLGYLACPRKLAIQGLTVDAIGALPHLGEMTAAIVIREDLERRQASHLAAGIEAALRSAATS